jgi:hypothetical protein
MAHGFKLVAVAHNVQLESLTTSNSRSIHNARYQVLPVRYPV